MAKHYFALVNSENMVEQVIVGPEEYPEENDPGIGKQWVETFMNHPSKNYAGIGYTYDFGMDDFLSPKPFPSWVQDGNKWAAPVARPEGDNWKWEEATGQWVEWVGFPDE